MSVPMDTAGPAYIRNLDTTTGEVTETPSSEVPEGRRFVFLRGGNEVASRELADEVLPVVEVHVVPMDAKGRMVPRERATRIRIEEFGPGGRLLRWTMMTR